MLRYESQNNAHVFDMNIAVYNLTSTNLYVLLHAIPSSRKNSLAMTLR
jgi:hypothetical protein